MCVLIAFVTSLTTEEAIKSELCSRLLEVIQEVLPSTSDGAARGTDTADTSECILRSPRPWHGDSQVIARIVARSPCSRASAHAGNSAVLLRVSPKPRGCRSKRIWALLMSSPWPDPLISGCLVMQFRTMADAQVAYEYYTNRGYLVTIS